MRQLTLRGCDPFWAVFCRESLTVALLMPWLAMRTSRGEATLYGRRLLGGILLAGLLLQLVSNTCVQWSLGIVGLAVTIPAFFGVSIAGGAILARVWLGERISSRSTVAIAMFLGALAALGIGVKWSAASNVTAATGSVLGTLGLAAAGLAGLVSTTFGITVRQPSRRLIPPANVAFLVSLIGVCSLGPICFCRFGLQPLRDLSWEQVAWVSGAGVCNCVGFLSWIVGFQRTTVVRANILSASQVAMASAAGIIAFGEQSNVWLFVGIGLTISGVAWINRPSASSLPAPVRAVPLSHQNAASKQTTVSTPDTARTTGHERRQCA